MYRTLSGGVKEHETNSVNGTRNLNNYPKCVVNSWRENIFKIIMLCLILQICWKYVSDGILRRFH